MAAVQRAATPGRRLRRPTHDLVLAAEDGTVWFGRIVGARRPRGHLDAAVTTRAPAPTSARPPPIDPLPNGRRSSGWRGPTPPPGSPAGSATTDGTSGVAPRCRRRAGVRRRARELAAGRGRSPGRPRRPNRSPRPSACDNRRDRSVLVWFDEGSAADAPPARRRRRPAADRPGDRPPAGRARAATGRCWSFPATGEALVAASLDQQPATALTYALHDGLAIRAMADASHYVELDRGPGATGRIAARRRPRIVARATIASTRSTAGSPWRADVPVPPPRSTTRCRTSTATARAGGRAAARSLGQEHRTRTAS